MREAQRSIKFRAWDTVKKVWIYRDVEDFFDDCWYARDIKDFIWCQYTGLKDKSGKEIFEGDIVKEDTNEIGTIIWVNKICGFEINMVSVGRHCLHDDLEIIGNIYEHPEILTKENNP